MNTRTFILISLLLAIVFANSYVPTPKRSHGVLIGSAGADVQVELVYDAQCDGSWELNQIVKSAIAQLGSLANNISFRYYFTALPYHIHSFKMARGLEYISQKTNASNSYNYIQYCLSNIQKWSEISLQNTSLVDFQKNFSDEVSQLFGVDKNTFYRAIKHFSEYDTAARSTWKYLQGMRSVSGTPRVFINGVFQDGFELWTATDLANYLKTLI